MYYLLFVQKMFHAMPISFVYSDSIQKSYHPTTWLCCTHPPIILNLSHHLSISLLISIRLMPSVYTLLYSVLLGWKLKTHFMVWCLCVTHYIKLFSLTLYLDTHNIIYKLASHPLNFTDFKQSSTALFFFQMNDIVVYF